MAFSGALGAPLLRSLLIRRNLGRTYVRDGVPLGRAMPFPCAREIDLRDVDPEVLFHT